VPLEVLLLVSGAGTLGVAGAAGVLTVGAPVAAPIAEVTLPRAPWRLGPPPVGEDPDVPGRADCAPDPEPEPVAAPEFEFPLFLRSAAWFGGLALSSEAGQAGALVWGP
jgi:hypothetical protein